MNENIATLEKPQEIFTSSHIFNSLPQELKLIQLKILNGQQLSQDEKNDYNDAADEIASNMIGEINGKIAKVREKLSLLHGRKQNSEELTQFVRLSRELAQLHLDIKEIVAEADRLLIL